MFACVLPLSRLRSEQDSCIIVGKTQLGTLSPNKKKKIKNKNNGEIRGAMPTRKEKILYNQSCDHDQSNIFIFLTQIVEPQSW